MNRTSSTEVVLNIDAHAAAGKMGLAGAGAAASYLTLNEWVALATLIYVLLQIGLLFPKYATLYKAWRDGKRIKVDVE